MKGYTVSATVKLSVKREIPSLRSGKQFQGANIKATTEGGNSKKSMMIMTESSCGCNDTLLLRSCRHL
jgi:hypothetical protein